jgi:hypothetical protein
MLLECYEVDFGNISVNEIKHYLLNVIVSLQGTNAIKEPDLKYATRGISIHQ